MTTKKTNLFLIVLTSIGGIYYSINQIIDGEIYKFLSSLSVIAVVLIPKILKKRFKFDITSTLEFIYLVFIFIAHFLGSIVDFYHIINNYDKIMHLLSGIVAACFGLYILINLEKYDKKNIFFNILFIVSFVLMTASLWEFFEYFGDILFKQDAQNVLTTGIHDTMKDMIAAFLGSILFSIIYMYEEKTGNKTLINKFITIN